MSANLLTRNCLAQRPLPDLGPGSDKDVRGTVLIIAGGASAPGAASLSGRAALRVGAGKLQLAAPRSLGLTLGVAVPEAGIVTVIGGRGQEFSAACVNRLREPVRSADAVCVGPGLRAGPVGPAMAMALMEAAPGTGFVIDAAALPSPEDAPRFAAAARGRVVLTPHAGEMAGMLGVSRDRVIGAPLEAARQAADRFRSVVIMKGGTSFMVTPDGLAWRHEGGVVGLGTSGSGDVLAGIVAGLLARGASPLTAAMWGVFLHASAGRELSDSVGPLGFLASELLAVLPGQLGSRGGDGDPAPSRRAPQL